MMGLYNIQPRFVPFILEGLKTHTIRAERVRPDKPGNTLHLYTGLRTKQAALLMRVECVRVDEIEIDSARNDGIFLWEERVRINGQTLDASEKELLARRDGFKNFRDMMQFWNGRLPFRGQIIHWRAA